MNNKPLSSSVAISSNSGSSANDKWLGDVLVFVLARFFFMKSPVSSHRIKANTVGYQDTLNTQ